MKSSFWDAIPGAVQLPLLVACLVGIFFAARKHRRQLLVREAEEGTGGEATKALKKQRLGGIAMIGILVLLGVMALVTYLPDIKN